MSRPKSESVQKSYFTIQWNMHATDEFCVDQKKVIYDNALDGAEEAAKMVYRDAKATLSRPASRDYPWQPAQHPRKREGELLEGLYVDYVEHGTPASELSNIDTNPVVLVGNRSPEAVWQEKGTWVRGLFGEDEPDFPYPFLAPAAEKNRARAVKEIQDAIRGK